MKADPDGSEHYFTIDTDSTNQHALFSTQGCGCLAWSPDRSEIWAASETDHGTLAFTTMQPDGSGREVHEPPIATLSLVPGAATPDGSLIAFNGWDETEPDRNGIWVSSTDLTGLRQVTQLPEGAMSIATTPLGITPDARRILFFAETGSDVGIVTHAGDLYVVDTDGDNLRQLNDDSLHLSMVQGLPATLSPDGKQAAFAAFEGEDWGSRSAIYVVSLDGGVAERITDFTGSWSAIWAPVGDLITFGWTTLSVVKADGSERRDLSDRNDSVGVGAWSPDGTLLLVARGADLSRRDLWIIDLEGNYVGQVTHDPADYALNAWGPRTSRD